MELTKQSLKLLFLCSLLLTLFGPILWPSVQVAFFVPFIVIAYYQKPYLTSLWISLLCGVILDVLFPSNRMGLWCMSYTLTTMMLFKYRMHFFGDRQSTLPIMTFLFSLVSTGFYCGVSYFFDKNMGMSFLAMTKELLLIPFENAVYAYLMILLPVSVVKRIKSRKTNS